MRKNPPRDRLEELERVRILELSQDTLWNNEDGKEALDYLRENRKFSDRVIKKFELGYVPLYVENFQGDQHELAGRITIPIRDHYGELIAFSSRNWRSNAINRGFWHESFDKSRYLYGLNIAKENIISKRKAVIVEGETDTISSHKVGINFTVGILGGSISVYQLALLMRYCNEIFLAFDGDNAGNRIMEKAMDIYNKLLKPYAKNGDILFIPVKFPSPEFLGINDKKVDPDAYIKIKGRDSLINLYKNSRDNFNADKEIVEE